MVCRSLLLMRLLLFVVGDVGRGCLLLFAVVDAVALLFVVACC